MAKPNGASGEIDRGLPMSIEAERAVLGAVLLDNFAFTQTAGILTADEFALDSHRRIYQAMVDLSAESMPIDFVTLTEQLAQRKEVEAVGGVQYVTSLTDGLPRVKNIEQYVRLVKDKARLRRLIMLADSAMRQAYDQADPAQTIISAVEADVMELSAERSTTGLMSIPEIVQSSFGSIDALYEQGQRITGVETFYEDFDNMTSGLQNGDLIIIAARPSCGKTAYAMNIAENCAIRSRKTVAVFSLEMSRRALIQRMLCSQARVDSLKLRTGFLGRDDYSKLVAALADLLEAPIFVDDNSAITVPEIRGKCRRLKQVRGALDLIIVDYLQLLATDKKYDNRTQEVSSYSRGLKALAKDMSCPVVALSQLSRAPEMRSGNKRPMLADLRESGCLAGHSLVPMSNGRRVAIAELVDRTFSALVLNETTMQLEWVPGVRAVCSGRKKVLRMTTRLGRCIDLTASHELLTIGGWRQLSDLSPGICIALPRVLRTGNDGSTMSDDELILMAHLIGNGSTVPSQPTRYVTPRPILGELVCATATRLFGEEIAPRMEPDKLRKCYNVFLKSTKRHTHGVFGALRLWLESYGVFGHRSRTKHVPEKVFMQGDLKIAFFIKHLWSTDGSIFVPGQEGIPNIYYSTSSFRLARDVQSLLLRVGINAVIRPPIKDNYQVCISGKSDMMAFISLIGAVDPERIAALDKLRMRLELIKENTNRDVIPKDAWLALVTPAMQLANITSRQMQAGLNQKYCGTTIYKSAMSRERAARVAKVVLCERLARLAVSDVYWDQIKSIEAIGTDEIDVFDLIVPGYNHNFVAEDIVVHNSIEQDADVVSFLFREEMYDPGNPDLEGKAELIVAKQRSGPTGTVPLAFIKRYTKFENLAAGVSDPLPYVPPVSQREWDSA